MHGSKTQIQFIRKIFRIDKGVIDQDKATEEKRKDKTCCEALSKYKVPVTICSPYLSYGEENGNQEKKNIEKNPIFFPLRSSQSGIKKDKLPGNSDGYKKYRIFPGWDH